MIVNWNTDLGSPSAPGEYTISNVGTVQVEQDDIDTAARLGGNPDVELLDATTFGRDVRHYVIGHFIP